jgi:hypothetical protein
VTSIGALYGRLRRVRRLAGIEQLSGLCANAGIGRAVTAARTPSNGPTAQTQAD